jgi:hypothetical protein
MNTPSVALLDPACRRVRKCFDTTIGAIARECSQIAIGSESSHPRSMHSERRPEKMRRQDYIVTCSTEVRSGS